MPIVFVLDGLDIFRRENDDRYDLLDLLDTVYLDGPSVGVCTLLSASSPNELRHFAPATGFRLYLRTADTLELREIGVRGAVDPEPSPGRGHLAPHGLEVQVALCDDRDIAAAASHPAAFRAPMSVGVLNNEISIADLLPPALVDDSLLWVPLGRRNSDLETVGFSLRRGEHAVIAGPGRSGKTVALSSIAHQLNTTSGCLVRWFGATSPIEGIETISADELGSLTGYPARTVVLIDDVETTADHGQLAEVLSRRDGLVHLIVAGRVDLLRASYGHWTNEFKQVRRGVLLWPDILDGDVVGVDLPSRTTTAAIPGRGVLVQGGSIAEVQLAR